MKKKIANQSLVILILIVCFGLFQAWKESRNPFALYSNYKNKIEKSKTMSNKLAGFDIKDNYTVKRYIKQ